MKKIKLLTLTCLLLSVVFMSCKKEDPKKEDPAEPTSEETVYIMGTYGVTKSFLLTNDKLSFFNNNIGDFGALDMAIADNGDLYVAGEVEPDDDGALPSSMLFKNGVPCYEYGFDYASFCRIAIEDNGKIVLAGLHFTDQIRPAVWDGTTATNLPLPAGSNISKWYITSMDYRNGHELIAGFYVNANGKYVPAVWVDRQLVNADPMSGASAVVNSGTLTNGANFKIAGNYLDEDGNYTAYEYDSQTSMGTRIPYQWEGSNVSMAYGIVNSSKWNKTEAEGAGSIYSLVTEDYEHYAISPTTGEPYIDTCYGGFYVVKDGSVMPQTMYRYPQTNTISSIIDMSINSKNQLYLVGSFYTIDEGIKPAYWIDGVRHVIDLEKGVASKIIIKPAQK